MIEACWRAFEDEIEKVSVSRHWIRSKLSPLNVPMTHTPTTMRQRLLGGPRSADTPVDGFRTDLSGYRGREAEEVANGRLRALNDRTADRYFATSADPLSAEHAVAKERYAGTASAVHDTRLSDLAPEWGHSQDASVALGNRNRSAAELGPLVSPDQRLRDQAAVIGLPSANILKTSSSGGAPGKNAVNSELGAKEREYAHRAAAKRMLRTIVK
jgi:hypothetical protein